MLLKEIKDTQQELLLEVLEIKFGSNSGVLNNMISKALGKSLDYLKTSNTVLKHFPKILSTIDFFMLSNKNKDFKIITDEKDVNFHGKMLRSMEKHGFKIINTEKYIENGSEFFKWTFKKRK